MMVLRHTDPMPPPPACQWCGAAMELGGIDCICDRCIEESRPREVRFDEYE